MKQPLAQRWLSFLNIAIDPWVAIFFVIDTIVVCINANNTNHLINLILSLLTVFLSCLIGIRLNRIWLDTANENILILRGKTSIRNLLLLIENIIIIKKRIQIYISRQDEEQNKKSIILCFEELIEKCNVLEKEVINSIEYWSDIIPDANISTKLEDISLISKSIKKEKLQTEKLKRELELIKAKPEKDKEQLKNIIHEKIKIIIDKEKEIDNKIDKINSSILGGINVFSLSKLSYIDRIASETH